MPGHAMTDTNVFKLAQIIKNTSSDPGDVTTAVWSAGYRKPVRSAEDAVALTLEIIAGFQGNDLPWNVWPKDYDAILQCELNELIDEELWRNKSNAVNAAKSIIDEGYMLGRGND